MTEIKVKLKVREVEIELTKEEAAELFEALRPFAKQDESQWAQILKRLEEPRKEYVPLPYAVPQRIDPWPPWPTWPQPYIWCSTSQQVTCEVIS